MRLNTERASPSLHPTFRESAAVFRACDWLGAQSNLRLDCSPDQSNLSGPTAVPHQLLSAPPPQPNLHPDPAAFAFTSPHVPLRRRRQRTRLNYALTLRRWA